MRLEANIGDVQSVIEIRDEGGRVVVDIDGRAYRLELQESLTTGRYVFNLEGRVFECHVAQVPKPGQSVEVIVGNTHFPISVIDPKRLRSAASTTAQGDEAARIIAPMPGKVVRVLVEAGMAVESGDGIVVVEAMKMQNEMKSPKAGVVSALNVQPGATVNAGDVLAVIE